jgi:hydroxyacylglutathione hydrolase
VINVGTLPVRCLHTPGHTPGCLCFHADESVFTGDTLFVDACGRCDFAGGSPKQMFDSLHRVLGALPDRTTVYPGHDYGDVAVSSLERERARNPYLQVGSAEAFTAFRMRPRG